MSRILITGLPRSGTTWIARMLQNAEGATLVFEPDNHQMFPFAFKAKRSLPGGYYPFPRPGSDARLYEELWRNAFGERGASYSALERVRRKIAHRLLRSAGEERIRGVLSSSASMSVGLELANAFAVPERPPRQTRDLLVKSVYTPLAIEWITELVEPKVVIMLRGLRNTVSSWVELGWIGAAGEDELAASDPGLQEDLRSRFNVPPLRSAAPPIARMTWLLGLYTLSLEEAARRHPEWQVVQHEEISSRLPDSLQEIAAKLGLQWTKRADQAIAAAMRPGRGFEIARLPDTLRDAWKKRLTPEQIAEVDGVLATFPRGLR